MKCEIVLFIIYFIKISNAYFKYNTFKSSTLESTRPPTILKAKAKMCLLLPEHGPCRAGITMYYYNPEAQGCMPFIWGGCQGNGNKFDTERECERSCKDINPPARRPQYCDLTFDYGYCFGSLPRWFYDRFAKTCKEGIYSGCGGNKNNFYSKERCDEFCRFGKPYSLYTDSGNTTKNPLKRLIVNPSHTSSPRPDFITRPSDPSTIKNRNALRNGPDEKDGKDGTSSESNENDGSNQKRETSDPTTINNRNAMRNGPEEKDGKDGTSSESNENDANNNKKQEEISKSQSVVNQTLLNNKKEYERILTNNLVTSWQQRTQDEGDIKTMTLHPTTNKLSSQELYATINAKESREKPNPFHHPIVRQDLQT